MQTARSLMSRSRGANDCRKTILRNLDFIKGYTGQAGGKTGN
jgi:hypothetical protein